MDAKIDHSPDGGASGNSLLLSRNAVSDRPPAEQGESRKADGEPGAGDDGRRVGPA